MFIAAAIVSVLFAALLVLSAFGKLTHEKGQAATLARVGATPIVPLLAVIELAAAGLLIGLVWSPLGVAAAIGLVLYFASAITAHLRVETARSSSRSY